MKKNNIAFVFPGQGSQSVGMLSNLAQEFPIIEETFDEASEVLQFDLWQLVQEGPLERLNQYSQPAILTADIAIWRLWKSQNDFLPAFVAGHSLGEYAALVAASAIQFSDAVHLVLQRAQFMQNAVKDIDTAVAVILALENEAVIDICQKAQEGQPLYPINFNLPGQVVIAGEKKAVARAVEYAKEAKAKIRELPMSIPSHSPLMAPAAEALKTILKEIPISEPKIPLINNANITIESNPEAIRNALVTQLTNPIRWVALIQKIQSFGVDTIIECGPKNVLTNMSKRIAPEIKRYALNNSETLEELLKIEN